MGNSYKNIYAKLGARDKVKELKAQEDLSNLNALKLGYLHEAFLAYQDSKKGKVPAEPVTTKAYKKFAEQNPDFMNYHKAALLLYHEKLDAVAVKSRDKHALEQAVKLALTSLTSKKIIKIDKGEIDAVIGALVEKAERVGAANYATTKDWHTDLAAYTVAHKKPKKMAAAQGEINKAMQKALTALEPYAHYGTETIDYDFAKVIEYACKQYEDLNLNPSDKRKADLVAIRDILKKFADHETKKIPPEQVDNAVKAIAGYFSSSAFSRGFSSRFEDCIKKAVDGYFERLHKTQSDIRTLQTKTWSDSGKEASKKLVLAVHGLQDSVNTFNTVANQYVRKGYKVLSYDQSGAAFDESRGKEDLNLRQMQFDFYSMLEKAYADPDVDEIVLLGHSLGGAVIANALNMIHQLNEEGEPKNKIKKIQLMAPAVMKNPKLQIIGNLPTILSSNPGNKDEHAQLIEQQGIRREGGASALSSLSDFIKFVANAFKNLKEFFKKDNLIPLEVHYSEADGLVNKSNFEEIAQSAANPKAQTFKNQGQHHFHRAPDSTVVTQIEELPDDAPAYKAP
ncbi:short chain dehydrogenase [Legionella steelei]|uniref:Short chain dehydrogenase n=1 Tax=Legionella steelei TaxID=947033 RepID=A0A0W0ZKH9_9GAMM|nr:alpha/beta fold hydrolase [Legionella steelei]KTD69350.1 short chain dehydrogenase [Legionella steelei]